MVLVKQKHKECPDCRHMVGKKVMVISFLTNETKPPLIKEIEEVSYETNGLRRMTEEELLNNLQYWNSSIARQAEKANSVYYYYLEDVKGE